MKEDKKDCAGCYACINICPVSCISMEMDKEGFWYPKIDTKDCISCQKCLDVCPHTNKRQTFSKPLVYAVINKNKEVRLKSSSGGVFSLLAEIVIEKGGLVFGAGFNKDFEVEHSYIEKKEHIVKFQGSKYVQSKIGDTYKQAQDFLEARRLVLFSGTPCQIEGLKAYLRETYENLFCVDIICHGVPSPLVWKKYIKYREEIAQSKISSIFFRNKDVSWEEYSLSFLFSNDTRYQQVHRGDPYMKTFLKNLCLRPSCYACNFKTINRKSDITLADFWGIDNILPKMNDNKGCSLVIIHSNKGKQMLKDIASKISCKKVLIDDVICYNKAINKSAELNPKREIFLKNLDKVSFDKLAEKYSSEGRVKKIRKKIKSVYRLFFCKN